MESQESFSALKVRAEDALRAARILFPSSSATSPVDNSVEGLLERLRLSEDIGVSDSHATDQVRDDGQVDPLDKQELLRRGAERGLELLETVQEWLILEEQKTELGLTSTDCKLTTTLFTEATSLI